MLCRTANELYWMGRHIERAENVARLLDVTNRMSLLPYELVEPGLVPVPEWRPDPGTPIRADYGVVLSMACAGVARLP